MPLLFIAGVLALAGPAPALPGSGSPGRASTIKVYHAFGDSVTAVTGSPLYPNQIATNFGLTLTNRAVSGYTSDQMNEIESFPNEYPTTSSPQINTILIGTNDANLFGFSGEADDDANLLRGRMVASCSEFGEGEPAVVCARRRDLDAVCQCPAVLPSYSERDFAGPERHPDLLDHGKRWGAVHLDWRERGGSYLYLRDRRRLPGLGNRHLGRGLIA